MDQYSSQPTAVQLFQNKCFGLKQSKTLVSFDIIQKAIHLIWNSSFFTLVLKCFNFFESKWHCFDRNQNWQKLCTTRIAESKAVQTAVSYYKCKMTHSSRCIPVATDNWPHWKCKEYCLYMDVQLNHSPMPHSDF